MILYFAIPGLKNCRVIFNRGSGVDVIIEQVCKYFDIERKQMMARSRRRDLVDARGIAMHFLFVESGLNKSQIAGIFSMDHTSVIHMLHRYDDLLTVDPSFRSAVNSIESQLT